MPKVFAPFSDDQVLALNRWQRLGYVHEFTCPKDHAADRTLLAKPDGWICPACGYRQNWAHDFMLTVPPHARHV